MTFMLESIERLLVGSDLTNICENTLQHILSRIRLISKFSNETISHFRKIAKISRGDMLLMVLLSHTLDIHSDTCGDNREDNMQSFDDKLLTSLENFYFTDSNTNCIKFNVKSQRNMTLLGIDAHIKGLIGFVYIDRTVNEVIIAPIESMNPENGLQMSANEFNTIASHMISHAYRSLINGHMTSVWADGVFQYTYILQLSTQYNIRIVTIIYNGTTLEPRSKRLQLDTYPSIISGNFIQDIITAIFCKDPKSENKCHVNNVEKPSLSCYPYELFCIYNTTLILDE
ncbi:unnamed protein product, partial [Medioppia subpectinata]